MFAHKNYPSDGCGQYFATATEYAKQLSVSPDRADVSAIFCGRFLETFEQAGKWIQLHPDIFDFESELKNMHGWQDVTVQKRDKCGLAVGAIVWRDSWIERKAFDDVMDFAAYFDGNASDLVSKNHALFYVLTLTRKLAEKWINDFDANDYIDVRDEMYLVSEWRRDNAALDIIAD